MLCIGKGALFYSPVDFSDVSDLSTLVQVWCIGEINRWIKQRALTADIVQICWSYSKTQTGICFRHLWVGG